MRSRKAWLLATRALAGCGLSAAAIGGLVGANMALAGETVTLIDMGAHLEAIKKNGLKVIMADGQERVAKDVRATDKFSEAGKQDLVVLALNANVIEEVVEDMKALYGPDTVILPLQSGLPWWYFQRLPASLAQGAAGALAGRRVEAVDPQGTISAAIDPARVIGCVVYPAAELSKGDGGPTCLTLPLARGA